MMSVFCYYESWLLFLSLMVMDVALSILLMEPMKPVLAQKPIWDDVGSRRGEVAVQ